MAQLIFPTSPADQALYTHEGRTWKYTSSINAWEEVRIVSAASVGAAAINHTHGNISSDGKIGSTATLPIITTIGGTLTTGSFGSSAGTFTQGNDSRLSDARTPTSHASTHSTGGSDPITPVSIGAQPAGTYATGTGSASGVNTGDETESTIKTKLGITTLSGSNTGDQDLSGLVPYTGATGPINLGSHNLTVDTNTLFVDATNNRVGIGTITPTAGYSLDVTGAIRSTGNLLLQGSIVYLNSQQALTQGINSLTLGAATYFTSLAYGNASTTKHTFGSGNIGIANANPTEKLDVTGNILASGISNRLPNQSASTSDAIITRGLGDLRYLEKNPVTEDTLSHTTEQFEDFDKYVDVQAVGSLTAATAFGSTTFGASQLFANQISPVGGWTDNDRYTWNGAYLIRLSTASNQAGYLILNRVLNSDLLLGTEITYRFMLTSTGASTSYFKIGPVPFGGTGGGDQSLRGGLVYNPALFGNGNLYIAASTSTAASPFTFTTTIGNVHYVDTGFNYTPYLDKWINITYRWQVISSTNYLRIIIKRDNVTLYDSTDINLSQAPYSTWTGSSASTLYAIGASRKLGFAFGTITYTSRQELFIDYVHEKITHTAAWTPPSNWNALRF